MKIAFLSFYSGLVDRGVETFVQALASRLSNHNEVLVIQTGEKQSSSQYLIKTIPGNINWPDVNPTGWQRSWLIDYYYRKIFAFTCKSLVILDQFNPDVIIPNNGGWQSLLMKLYCLRNKKKLVIIGHAGLGRDERWNLLLKPDLYVALTNRNLEWVKKYAPRQKTAVIPNGVDLERFGNHQLRKGLESIQSLAHPRILCVAGPEGYKRVLATIEAVSLLPKASLIVAGGSSDTLEKGKKMLGDRFIQLKVAHELMPQLYLYDDLFTLVSEESEAFGIAYIEALASNLPIVCPNDRLRREVVGNSGVFIANPLNANEYAEKLKEALQKKWGTVPRKQAEKYDWDMISLEYEKQFNYLRT